MLLLKILINLKLKTKFYVQVNPFWFAFAFLDNLLHKQTIIQNQQCWISSNASLGYWRKTLNEIWKEIFHKLGGLDLSRFFLICLDLSQLCLNLSRLRFSISIMSISKSRQSRKSQHFQNLCLDGQDILIEIEISRFCHDLSRSCLNWDSQSWRCQ